MKTTGVSDETKFKLLVFLGHPIGQLKNLLLSIYFSEIGLGACEIAWSLPAMLACYHGLCNQERKFHKNLKTSSPDILWVPLDFDASLPCMVGHFISENLCSHGRLFYGY